jgi:glutaminyl-peptide cyclotransferase
MELFGRLISKFQSFKFKVSSFSVLLLCTLYIVLCTLSSCHNDKKVEQEKAVEPVYVRAPEFNADSAFAYLKTQVDFGPRTPGSKAHAKCADYLQAKMKGFGWEVKLQTGKVKTYDNKTFDLKNIISSYKPELTNRVLLLAHWDCRPFADEDAEGKDKPIDGANDGASGVATLMEIARQISLSKPNFGIDILFVDLEDYGQQYPETDKYDEMPNSWALGTQYWANNLQADTHKAQYGILLDMVGGINPMFPKEGSSLAFAPNIVEKVWTTAARIGYGNYFVNDQMGQTTDDHVYINQIAKIPCVDIVHMNPSTGTYPLFHHSKKDNMSIIDKNTLKMVGQVVLETIYN